MSETAREPEDRGYNVEGMRAYILATLIPHAVEKSFTVGEMVEALIVAASELSDLVEDPVERAGLLGMAGLLDALEEPYEDSEHVRLEKKLAFALHVLDLQEQCDRERP